MIADSKEVGAATLEELERQRAVITNIEMETDRIDDNLARAEVLLKQFGKRMASDHFIQCFAVINCLLLLAVILYAIIKNKGFDEDDNTPPSPTAGECCYFICEEESDDTSTTLALKKHSFGLYNKMLLFVCDLFHSLYVVQNFAVEK